MVKLMVKRFYEKNQEPMRFDEDKVEWRIAKDKYCRLMFGIEDEDEKV